MAQSTRRRAIVWPLVVVVVTAAYAMIPALFHPMFYMRGDTDAQFAPTWFHLGQLVREGQWPVMLDPNVWVGGNYLGEALFGVYDPLNIPIWLLVSASSDLLVAVLVVKTVALVVLALGVYALARNFDARPWAAAVVAVALPFSGYTLFWDAGSWAAGLIGFAYTPWVWWGFRRVLQRRLNPFWAFLIGSLAVLQGNPYGTLGVTVVGLAVLVEAAVTRDRRAVLTIAALGLCVAAWIPLVYLPLLDNADLAVRAQGGLFGNNGKLRPALADLLALSSPTYVPQTRAVAGEMAVPASYFAWFVLPLLPWLRYDVLRRRGRELVGVATLVGVYFVLAIGPSKLWLFRWPYRMVEYLYLGVAVAFAVVLSAGLRSDRRRERSLATAGLVLVLGWLTWSQDPAWRRVAYSGPLLLVLLSAVLLVLVVRAAGARALAALLIAGCGVTLTTQAAVFGENQSSRPWFFPNDVSLLQQRFADRHGRVLQFADVRALQAPGREARLRDAWRHYLLGSMYQVAGVDAVNSYSGMGYLPFTKYLCMRYDGTTGACGYRRVWRPDPTTGVPLVDLMKVDTVVAEPSYAQGVKVPPGWRVTSTRPVTVVERTIAEPWPQSQLSWVSPGLEVTGARTDGPYGQTVDVASTGPNGGTAVFSMLDWPGYQATLDGRPVPVSSLETGLLTVELPPDAQGTLQVTYRPPHFAMELALGGLGVLGALAMGGTALARSRVRVTAGRDIPHGAEVGAGPAG